MSDNQTTTWLGLAWLGLAWLGLAWLGSSITLFSSSVKSYFSYILQETITEDR